jgi:hypothetical protein
MVIPCVERVPRIRGAPAHRCLVKPCAEESHSRVYHDAEVFEPAGAARGRVSLYGSAEA